jgi:hypothetical protein
MEMQNNTRMWINNGYSPNELRQLTTQQQAIRPMLKLVPAVKKK